MLCKGLKVFIFSSDPRRMVNCAIHSLHKILSDVYIKSALKFNKLNFLNFLHQIFSIVTLNFLHCLHV